MLRRSGYAKAMGAEQNAIRFRRVGRQVKAVLPPTRASRQFGAYLDVLRNDTTT